MANTTAQKQHMIDRSLDLARRLGEWQADYKGFKEEYDAEDYGNTTNGVTDTVLTAYAPSSGLTNSEWTSGVGAMDTISGSITTNKTNIYKVAKGEGSA